MTAWYFVLSGVLLYTDLTGRPDWMKQYKVQPGENQPVSVSYEYCICNQRHLLAAYPRSTCIEVNI